MFFSVMELMTGKAHVIEADSQEQASKYYNSDKYVIVPTDDIKSNKDRRYNGSIKESIDPVETLKPAPPREIVLPKVWDGTEVVVLKG
jgi:hypothetical protein